MSNDTRLLAGDELHEAVISDRLLEARSHVWIATADLKDMHIKSGRHFKPVLETFDDLARRGVSFRIVHSSLPSKPFRNTLEGYGRLSAGALELQVCPRSHWKIVIVDHRFAYCGSANFTGAGLGAKSDRKRNFEVGIVTTNSTWIGKLSTLFDEFWIGEHCEDCALRNVCPDPVR